MSLRDYLQRLQASGHLLRLREPISKTYEIAGLLKQVEPRPVLFEAVRESAFRVAGNLFCDKAAFAHYFDIPVDRLIPTLTAAIARRSAPEITHSAPCQEVINTRPTLDDLPILRHCQQDGGNYISSGVMITRHPRYGQNMDFHRMMQFSPTEMAVRVVRSRHFDTYLRDQRTLDVAICVGNAPNVLAAAATSVEIGIDELSIANAM